MMTLESRILAVATAYPPHVLEQDRVLDICAEVFAGRSDFFEKMRPVYENAGIVERRSCVPLEWYRAPHDWVERNRLYEENAVAILEDAARKALGVAGIEAADVDQAVCISTTGIATPSLDALLADRLNLRADIARLPIFGLGCAGGVNGLARADQLARARPGSLVLVLVVELCALTFRAQELSKSNIVASALFGDGGAALLLRADEGRDGGNGAATCGVAIRSAGEHRWPDSRDVMGWRVEADGFGVVFSRDIPALIRRDLGGVVEEFLSRSGIAREDLQGVIMHPGGPKVLAAYRECLDLPEDALADEAAVLERFGNMSAVTILAVLERVWRRRRGLHLAAALGPGFTAGMMVLDFPETQGVGDD